MKIWVSQKEDQNMEEFSERFTKVFSLAAFICNRHIINHMRRVSSGVGLDLETSFIWGILAHMNVSRDMHPGITPEDIMNPDGTYTAKLTPVRLIDVSVVSSLPRETVRRRLIKLQEAGKVTKTSNGHWVIQETGVTQDAIEFTIETARQLINTSKQLEALLSQVKSN